jgi:hypothetical protein
VKALALLLLLAACEASGERAGVDASQNAGDADRTVDGARGNALMSTLTSTCATLQGRAIVNENGNLGIAFTEHDTPYTFLGSVSFELPDGFTGAVPDPENWDGSSPRRVVAASSASFETFGNHCWLMGTQPSGGGLTITSYHPAQGIVKATFNGLQLRSCTGASICTINGAIETTGEGVFE